MDVALWLWVDADAKPSATVLSVVCTIVCCTLLLSPLYMFACVCVCVFMGVLHRGGGGVVAKTMQRQEFSAFFWIFSTLLVGLLFKCCPSPPILDVQH